MKISVKVILILAAGTCIWYPIGSKSLHAANIDSVSGTNSQDVEAATSLDFRTYRSRIEPIFLKKRQGDVRCYDCHSVMNTRLRLQPLSTGALSWSEEQSRLNFEVVSKLVTPNEPMKSRLLLHPLAAEDGGDPTHTGGKFWASQNDPASQMI